MARKGRVKSDIGIYHILLRGVNVLFAGDDDYAEFVRLSKKYISTGSIKIFAFVLLANRIHLVVKTDIDVGRALKPLCTSYARYFNRTYSRDGKLFYDRLKSEPINSNEELARVVGFVNNVAKRNGKNYSSLSLHGQSLLEKGVLTDEELQNTEVTEMFIEDYDCLRQSEIDDYILALCGTEPKDFKKLTPKEQEEAMVLIRKKRWIARSRLEKTLGIKNQRKKTEKPENKPKKRDEELSFWLL